MLQHPALRNLLSVSLPLLPLGAWLLWQNRLSPFPPARWFWLAGILLLAAGTAISSSWWPPLLAVALPLVGLVIETNRTGAMKGPEIMGVFLYAFIWLVTAAAGLGAGWLWRAGVLIPNTPAAWAVGLAVGVLLLGTPLALPNYRYQVREVQGPLRHTSAIFSHEGFSVTYKNRQDESAKDVRVTVVNGGQTVCTLSGPGEVPAGGQATYRGDRAQCPLARGQTVFVVRADYRYDGQPQPFVTVQNMQDDYR